MAKREFLMLAHVFDKEAHNPRGWYMSEKLDGMRCYYDGGISRGLLASEIPWANTAKDGRYKSPLKSSGLWSRYGKPIQAPDWFLDQLPNFPLDGELWSGRGQFQTTMSTVKQLVPDERWKNIAYLVFDAPSYREVFCNGEIKNTNFKKTFVDVLSWIKKRPYNPLWLDISRTFITALRDIEVHLKDQCKDDTHVRLHKQILLPDARAEALNVLYYEAEKIVASGAEGVMLRKPGSFWSPSRTHTLLKCKPMNDAEGEVIGFTWGKETDLGSKLLGRMGAMIVQWGEHRFKLSGFTDEERTVLGPNPYQEGMAHQGEVCENWDYQLKHFKHRDTVTFHYRELTDEGIPKEARYMRKKEDE